MWKNFASTILRSQITILTSLGVFIAILIGISLYFGVQFTSTSAQLLPDHHPAMQNFKKFKSIFKAEDDLITLGYNDEAMADPANFKAWNEYLKSIEDIAGVRGVFSMKDAIKLVRDTATGKLVSAKISTDLNQNSSYQEHWNKLKEYPFYESLLFNKKDKATQTLVYLEHDIADTDQRKEIVREINKSSLDFQNSTGIQLFLSGMPVIRTMNGEAIQGEVIMFILASLGVTSLIFFLFFRSFRATMVSLLVVICAVIFCFALMALLGFNITILTALVPPLLIVIGIPNCIFLLNKYQSEFVIHKNKIKGLQRMIIHVGNAAILTNFTTAFGFFTFIFTDSATLQEFGIVASLSIVAIFIFSILIIPTLYSLFPEPKTRHLNHLNTNWTNKVISTMEHWVINQRSLVFSVSIFLLFLSFIGIYQIKSSGNLLDDMSKNTRFYNDIDFFDKEFGGVLPLEIMIDSKRPNGITSNTVLTKIDSLSQDISSLNKTSKPLSIVNLVKFAKQGYYGGDSSYYNLPTQQERAFILNSVKGSEASTDQLGSFIDSTGRYARVTALLQNLSSKELEATLAEVQTQVSKHFPESNFHAFVSGGAFIFMKGTQFLTQNLLISLSLAIFMIAIFMAFMFKSFKMIVFSLIPNLLPLLCTAGLMGYLDIPLKPSTILVFSIAFGIAVDDTIHFLVKYRQDLKFYNGNIELAVKSAIEEVGTSMFYTSVILFAGFSIFMFSGFMGIVALGGLVSFTLLMAMLTNLILLPSLIMTTHEDDI